MRTGAKAVHVSREGEGDEVVVRLEDGTSVRAAELLVSVGRRARVGEIGLDTLGLDPAARALEVDERMRAGERLWAVGDVTGVGAFTHMAMYQAGIAIRDILGQDGPAADYTGLARVTFTDPEVGSVGLTERAAHGAGPEGPGRRRAGVELGAGLDPRPGQRRVHQAGRRRRRAACWSARPRSARGAARCSRCSPSRCTPGCRWPPCGR